MNSLPTSFLNLNVNSYKLSTGIDLLDKNMQLQFGDIFCIYEDENTRYHRQFVKIFVAANKDSNKLIISNLKYQIPTVIRKKMHQLLNRTFFEQYEVRYNMNQTYPITNIKNCNLQPLQTYNDLLNSISNIADNTIVICSDLLLKSWYNLDTFSKEFYDLKKLVKTKNLVLFVTIPLYLYDFCLGRFCDYILKLESYDEISNYKCLVNVLRGKYKVKMVGRKFGVNVGKYGIQMEEIDYVPEGNENVGCNMF